MLLFKFGNRYSKLLSATRLLYDAGVIPPTFPLEYHAVQELVERFGLSVTVTGGYVGRGPLFTRLEERWVAETPKIKEFGFQISAHAGDMVSAVIFCLASALETKVLWRIEQVIKATATAKEDDNAAEAN